MDRLGRRRGNGCIWSCRCYYKEVCSDMKPFTYGYFLNTDPNDSICYNQIITLESAEYGRDLAVLNPSASQVQP
jgi:hypothetical protein